MEKRNPRSIQMLSALLILGMLTGCGRQSSDKTLQSVTPETTAPETTLSEATEPETTVSETETPETTAASYATLPPELETQLPLEVRFAAGGGGGIRLEKHGEVISDPYLEQKENDQQSSIIGQFTQAEVLGDHSYRLTFSRTPDWDSESNTLFADGTVFMLFSPDTSSKALEGYQAVYAQWKAPYVNVARNDNVVPETLGRWILLEPQSGHFYDGEFDYAEAIAFRREHNPTP